MLQHDEGVGQTGWLQPPPPLLAHSVGHETHQDQPCTPDCLTDDPEEQAGITVSEAVLKRLLLCTVCWQYPTPRRGYEPTEVCSVEVCGQYGEAVSVQGRQPHDDTLNSQIKATQTDFSNPWGTQSHRHQHH